MWTNSSLGPFILASKSPFGISPRADVLVTNSLLSFIGKSISPSFLKDNFAAHRTLPALSTCYGFLISSGSMMSDEKEPLILLRMPVHDGSCFPSLDMAP